MNKKNNKFKILKNCELMEFLMEKFPEKSRNNIKNLLTKQMISINGRVETKYNFPLKIGDELEIVTSKISKNQQLHKIKIIFEDEDIIVIDKQKDLLSVATEKEKQENAYSILRDYLKKKNPKNKIFIVHRLDRDTSGIMIFSKNEKSKNILQNSWNESVKKRNYVALVEGEVKKERDRIESYLAENKACITYSTFDETKGKKAITEYKKILSNKDYSLLDVEIHTGKKNQIRVHMQDIGHSIVGDKKYKSSKNPIKRLGLHATSISFIHPTTKKLISFSSNIPDEFLKPFKK